MYRISELAEKAGLSRTTLLYYEKQGLISSRLRIPRHPATQSTLIWPGIPRPSGHLFHGHPAGQSERSDAGVALLV